jgi:hypothetical protein
MRKLHLPHMHHAARCKEKTYCVVAIYLKPKLKEARKCSYTAKNDVAALNSDSLCDVYFY